MRAAVHQLSRCRICSGQRLQCFLRFPQMPLTEDFIPPARLGAEFRHDLEVTICQDCLTAQTQLDVDTRGYYADYQYSVGGSPFAGHFMRLLARNLLARYFAGQKGSRVLEIGSGDGEQLVAFRELGCEVLGYEPSLALRRVAAEKGIRCIAGLFGADSLNRLPEPFKQADVIVLSYTFDHLPRPRELLAAARSILNPERGLLVVEVHDLQRILERGEYCLFEHEHTIYLTAATAAALAAREGMTIIDFELVPEADRRANSLLFVATPNGSRFAQEHPAAAVAVPAEYGDLAFYSRQAEGIHRAIASLDAFVERVSAAGKSLAGYGAGGRGVMTLAAMQGARALRYLADKKPKGVGLVAPKSGVPVVGLSALSESPVDEILVFSFGYLKEIQSELAAFGYQPRQFHSLLDVLAGKASL